MSSVGARSALDGQVDRAAGRQVDRAGFADAFSPRRASAGCGSDPDVLRVLDPYDEVMPTELIEAVVGRAVAAVESLTAIDPAGLDSELVTQWAEGVERIRRQVDASGIAVADHLDTENPFREHGFFTAKAWLKHRLQLSGAEAFRRVQAARMQRRLSVWAGGERAGLVGVAQTELLARIAANPLLDDELLAESSWDLLGDAIDLPYDDFARRARRWEALADPEGAAATAERNRDQRDAMILPRDDGGWDLHASLDGISGAEFREILAHFVDAEWRADWDEARRRLGDDATTADLRRTEPQRRADALHAMALAAASKTADAARACPTVNLLIDQDTFEASLRGEPVDTARYREVVCRTERGHELHPDDVVNTALWAHVRRVVHDSANVVIDLGRRRRLYQQGAREAVMLLEVRCAWVGCDRPAEWCQADHSIGWAAHGATVPRNGQPLCGRHNRLKETGYQVYRDDAGRWHTIHPEGREIT
jgi:hypothetical protein